jgi:hypothetical protein
MEIWEYEGVTYGTNDGIYFWVYNSVDNDWQDYPGTPPGWSGSLNPGNGGVGSTSPGSGGSGAAGSGASDGELALAVLGAAFLGLRKPHRRGRTNRG